MSVKIQGGSSTTNQPNVTPTFDLQVRTPSTIANAGYVGVAGINDIGSVTGSVLAKKIIVSENNKLEVGKTTLLWSDNFNSIAQNTTNYRAPVTTMTLAYSGGVITTNSSSTTSTATNCAYQTYRSFPLYGATELHCDIFGYSTFVAQANETIEFGLFSATLPSGSVPTDGVFFRINASAELRGVISFNGVETQTAAITSPSINVNHTWKIISSDEKVEFWIDNVLQATIDLISAAPTQGQPFLNASQPFTIRQYIGGSSPASVRQFKISDINIYSIDPDFQKPYQHQLAGMGQVASQGQNGGTLGSTALYTNSLALGAGAVMTNTTAALGSGFGGQFSALPTLAANTDGIICSYQNPTGSVTQTPRLLYITGVKIQGVVTTVLVGNATPIIYIYSLAYGHNSVSLATIESATVKAPRRIPVGIGTFAAAAALGTVGSPEGQNLVFNTPIPIYPGEFIQLVAKNVGAVTTTGVVTFIVEFDGYYE